MIQTALPVAAHAATLTDEIAAVRLDDANFARAEARWFGARWYNAQPLGRKLTLLGGGLLFGVNWCLFWTALAWAGAISAGHAVAAVLFAWTIAMGLGGIALRRVLKDTVGPLREMTAQMHRLAEGRRDIVVGHFERTDEIGEMAAALRIFLKSGHKLDEMFADRKRQRDDRQAELLALAGKFERDVGAVAGSLAASAEQLEHAASSMAAAAEQSSLQVDTVSRSLDDASGGVAAAAAASDEFAMSIGEISQQAAQSAGLAREATEAADKAEGTIRQLAATSEAVSEVVELIGSIARRTNLLALNASIEAARSGEAGRGFAVVAGEVKELATQSGKATDEVASQIRAMQQSTGAAVAALEAVAARIQRLETTAVSIASAVDQQSVAGQELARNIDTAARGTGEVSASTGQARETALATGATASQVLASAQALKAQAGELRGQLDGFLRQVRAG